MLSAQNIKYRFTAPYNLKKKTIKKGPHQLTIE